MHKARDAKNVWLLDIGCGEGVLGKIIGKSELGKKMVTVGVDVAAKAIDLSKQFYSETYVLDVESNLQELAGQPFDYIVCLELIEHIFFPERLLKTSKKLLASAGYLIISTPNFARYKNRLTVLRGTFPRDVHIFSAAEHIHYFTFHSFRSLLLDAGFKLIKCDGTYELPVILACLLRPKLSKRLFFARPNLWGKQIVYLARQTSG